MSKYLRAGVFALLLASCGGGSTAPRDLENACSIASERPRYFRAMQQAEREWGVPVHVQMATIHQESRFIANARPPMRWAFGIIPRGRASSARGYAQALDGTWEDYQRETGNRRARRGNIHDATDFIGWYMTKTQERNGISKHDARNQYLAYHEGHTGYARGSYNAKSWLLSVSNKVAARANRYQQQLQACGRV